MAMAVTAGRMPAARPMTAEERKVIIASSGGSVFEWYDFYLAGSLAANIAQTFVPGDNDTAKFVFVLFGPAYPLESKLSTRPNIDDCCGPARSQDPAAAPYRDRSVRNRA